MFHRNRFLCRAVSPEHAGQTITLKDIQAARSAHRRALRSQINERVAAVAAFLPEHTRQPATPPTGPEPRPRAQRRPATATATRLRTYREDAP